MPDKTGRPFFRHKTAEPGLFVSIIYRRRGVSTSDKFNQALDAVVERLGQKLTKDLCERRQLEPSHMTWARVCV